MVCLSHVRTEIKMFEKTTLNAHSTFLTTLFDLISILFYIYRITDKSPVYSPSFWKLSLRLALRTMAGYNVKTALKTHAVMF
jgi:hypothetical protein